MNCNNVNFVVVEISGSKFRGGQDFVMVEISGWSRLRGEISGAKSRGRNFGDDTRDFGGATRDTKCETRNTKHATRNDTNKAS